MAQPFSDPTARSLLSRLWREELSQHRGRIVVALVCTLALSGITALYPIVIQQAFDRFSRNDPGVVWFLPPLIIAVTSARAAAMYGQSLAVQGTVLRVVEGLQGKLFAAVTRADLAIAAQDAPARHAARFNLDAHQIREALSRAITGFANILTIIGLVGSMLWLDWSLALLAALLYPFAAVPILWIGKRIRRASSGMQDRVGETSAMLTESFASARVVRAYRMEGAEEARANRGFAEQREALFRIARARARLDPVLEVLGGLTVALVLGFVGWRVAAGQGTVGQFTGFAAALLIAAQPVRQLGSLNAALQEGLAGLTSIFGVIDAPRHIVDTPGAVPLPSGAGRVAFANVSFSYAGTPDTALSDLTFVAEPGQTVALVGPSGAGKSTALALVPRLYDVTAGAVTVDGIDVRQVTLASLRDAIAYVGQDATIFDDTAFANILCGRPGASRDEVEAAAQAAAAHEFIAALPQGYDTPLGTSGSRLSGGQKQRISLARALLRNPRVLLLDEATSALDAENEALVQAALARLRHGRTTLVIAHRLATVREADRIVVMQEGRAVETGSHPTLMAADGLYARLVRTQNFTET
jgi:ATP-binding cassette, subfamily B, bacterial MsbA